MIRSAVNDYLKKNALGVIRSDVLDVAYIREDKEMEIGVKHGRQYFSYFKYTFLNNVNFMETKYQNYIE